MPDQYLIPTESCTTDFPNGSGFRSHFHLGAGQTLPFTDSKVFLRLPYPFDSPPLRSGSLSACPELVEGASSCLRVFCGDRVGTWPTGSAFSRVPREHGSFPRTRIFLPRPAFRPFFSSPAALQQCSLRSSMWASRRWWTASGKRWRRSWGSSDAWL